MRQQGLGPGGPQGAPQPGQRVVQLNAEEMQQIQQLQQMGSFSQEQAVRAFIATGRNIEMAASLLFSGADAFSNEPMPEIQQPASTNNTQQNNDSSNNQNDSSNNDQHNNSQ